MGELRNRVIVQSRIWIEENPEPIPNLDYDYSYPKTVYDAIQRTMDEESTTLTEEIAAIYRLINGKQDQVAPGNPGDLMTWSGITGQIGSLSVVKAIDTDPANRSNKRVPTEKAVGDLVDTLTPLSQFTKHVNNTSIHITDVERTKWNSMAPLSSLQAHVANTHLHITDAERARWNAKAEQDELDQHIYDTTNPHNTTAHQVGTYTQSEIDEMFKNIRESFFNYLNIEWDSRFDQATLVQYNATNWNPNYVLAYGDELPDVENDELTYFALRPNTDYQVNETQDCIIWIKLPATNWRQVGLRTMKPGDMVIRYPDTGMFVWLQGHFMHLFTDSASADGGGIVVGDSNYVWYPTVDKDGYITWEKSNSKDAPEKVKIKGEDGYTPIKGVDYFDGKDGEGVPPGGLIGDFLVKASENNYDVTWKSLLDVLGDIVLQGGSLPEGIVTWDSIQGRPKWYTELGENDDGFVTQRVVSQRFDIFQQKINDILNRLDGAGGLSDIKQELYDHIHDFANPHRVTPAQIGAVANQTFLDHTSNFDNPHNVTAAQLGLGNVNNTADADKPISNPTQKALDEIIQMIENLENSTNGSDYVTEVAWVGNTCTITFVYKNGKQLDVKLPIPEIFKSMWFDNKEMELVIELPDGTSHRIDVAGLIRTYYGSISDNIQVSIEGNNIIRATVLPSSITDKEIINSVHLRGAPTTTTQPYTDKSDRIATTAYVRSTVIDNLISYEVDLPLSANMGRILNRNKVDLEDVIEIINDIEGFIVEDNLDSYNPLAALSANMGRYLNLTKAPRVHTSPEGSTYGIATMSEFGHVRASSRLPLMDGNPNVGIDNGYFSRELHIHPTDITRAPLVFPDEEHGQYRFLGEPRAENPPADSCDDRIATTQWVKENANGTYFGRCHTETSKTVKVVQLESSFVDEPKFTLQKGSSVSVTFTHDALPPEEHKTYALNLASSGPIFSIRSNSPIATIAAIASTGDYKYVEASGALHGSDNIINNVHANAHDATTPDIGDSNDNCQTVEITDADRTSPDDLKGFSDTILANIHNRAFNATIPDIGGDLLPIYDVNPGEDYREPGQLYTPEDDDTVDDIVDDADDDAPNGADDPLTDSKQAAIRDLENHAEEAKKGKDKETQDKIDKALEEAKKKVEDATSQEQIDNAVNEGKKKIDDAKESGNDEDPLKKEKDAAKKALDDWFNEMSDGVTDPELQEMKDIVEKAKGEIDSATSPDQIDNALKRAKKDLAKKRIDDAAKKAKEGKSEEEQKKIDEEAKKAKGEIEDAADDDEIKDALEKGEENIEDSTLNDAKEKAKEELRKKAEDAKKDADPETQQKIDDALKKAEEEIDNADSLEDIEDALQKGLEDIDRAADPWYDAKQAAKSDLEDHANRAKSGITDKDVLDAIDNAVNAAKDKIDSADNLSDVSSELQNGKSAIDDIVKKAQQDLKDAKDKAKKDLEDWAENAKEGKDEATQKKIDDAVKEAEKKIDDATDLNDVQGALDDGKKKVDDIAKTGGTVRTHQVIFYNGVGYTVSVTANDKVIGSGTYVAEGATVVVKVTVTDPDMEVDKISIPGAIVNQTDNVARFIMPIEDAVIRITLKEKLEYFILNYSNSVDYTLSVMAGGQAVTSGAKVPKGATVTVNVILTNNKKDVDTVTAGSAYVTLYGTIASFVMPAANTNIVVTTKDKTDVPNQDDYVETFVLMFVNGNGYSISATSNGKTINSGDYVMKGDLVTVNVTVTDSNREVDSIRLGASIIGQGVTTCIFNMPAANSILTVSLKDKDSSVIYPDIEDEENEYNDNIIRMNVQHTGAFPIKYGGESIIADMIKGRYTYDFTFDGLAWQLLNPTGTHKLDDSDFSNSLVSSEWVRRNAIGVNMGFCETPGNNPVKVCTLVNEYMEDPPFIRQKGSTVVIKFTYNDDLGYATMLNVHRTGPALVTYRGEPLEPNMIGANISHIFTWDGESWNLLNPAALPILSDTDDSNHPVTSEWINRNVNGIVACTCISGSNYSYKVAKPIAAGKNQPPFKLKVGAAVSVTFTYKDLSTTANPTKLNVDGTGLRTILFANAPLLDGMLGKGYTHFFVYDGEYWRLINPADPNSIWDEGGIVIGPGGKDPSTPPGGYEPGYDPSEDDGGPGDEDPSERVPDNTVVNLMSGYFGYTLKGSGSEGANGYVNCAQFMLTFTPQEYDLTCVISDAVDCFGAKMGNGDLIILSNPQVLNLSRQSCVIEFTMNKQYPSNSPCQLIYRTNAAWINIKKKD